MDMMALRRRLMAQMAKGAYFETGTFTVPSTGEYTLEFKKSMSSYVLFIEMTDASKTDLENTGISGNRAFGILYKYEAPSINSALVDTPILYYRLNPSTGAVSGQSHGTIIKNISASSVDLTVGSISSGAAYFYRDYSYNYTVVSLE